ncbi:hypothetical protein PJK55_08335 [Exiguobacterium sp. MMG028]|uniref:SH3 domain-containing protein n=1 Tax=Exiguobacterium sp. MMG028 TaxID=3021979 RepID=UPI0022FE8D00|nr:hypothetical protein [Exiguobacterium sp. MMG028]MDA5560734.1 hypothetical protein [Exiguobacterium sp. MMG028]
MNKFIKRLGAGLFALSLVTASPNPISFEPQSASAATQAKVFNKDTNIQAGAYRAAKVVRSVKQGEVADVLEVKGSWTKVRVGTVTGWVAGWDLSAKTAPVITKVFNKDTQIQSGAFRAAKVVRSVKQGEVASVLEVKGSWTKVRIGTVTGWVAGWDLSDKMAEAYEAVEAFVLKAGRYQAARVVANVPAGAKLERIAVHGSWSEVIYNGMRGFVANWSIRQQTAEKLVQGKRIRAMDIIQATATYNPPEGNPFYLYDEDLYVADLPKGDQMGFAYTSNERKSETYILSIVSQIYAKGPYASNVAQDMVKVKKLSLNYGEIIYGVDTVQSRQFANEFNRLYDVMHQSIIKQYPNFPKANYGTPGSFKIGDDLFTYRLYTKSLVIEFK